MKSTSGQHCTQAPKQASNAGNAGNPDSQAGNAGRHGNHLQLSPCTHALSSPIKPPSCTCRKLSSFERWLVTRPISPAYRNRHRFLSTFNSFRVLVPSLSWQAISFFIIRKLCFSNYNNNITTQARALFFSLPKRRRVARVTVLSLPRVGSTPPRWRWSCCRTPPHGV